MSVYKTYLTSREQFGRRFLRPKVWLQNTWRLLMHDPSILLFVSLALISFFLGVFEIWQLLSDGQSKQNELAPSIRRALIAIVLPFVLALPISVLLVKRKITPQVFATLVASKRSPADSLIVVVIEAARILKKFGSVAPLLEKYFDEIADNADDYDILRGEHEDGRLYKTSARAELKLKALWGRQCEQLRRLEALKHLLADDMGISSRRLCDSLIGFSPALYSHHINKLATYIRQLRDVFKSQGAIQESDYQEIIDKCRQRMDWLESQRVGQENNQRHFDLLSDVCRLSSGFSTGSALVAYASIVQRIAFETRAGLKKKNERWKFVYSKQKARPGFDLHLLLMKLFAKPLDGRETSARSGQTKPNPATLTGALRKIAESQACTEPDVDQVRKLAAALRLVQDKGQTVVSKSLQTYFGKIGKPETDKFVAVYGYSGTVVSATQALQIHDGNLLLITDTDDDWNVFETRMLKLEFEEHNPPIVDIRSLGAFIRSNTHVLILIGAEAYSLQTGVLHPRGMQSSQVLHDIQEQAPKDSVIEIICLAEQYKEQDLEVAFKLRDLDHLTIYPIRERKVISWILPAEITQAEPREVER